MTITLQDKLKALRAKHAARGAGWDKQYTDDMMRIVLHHHGYPYSEPGEGPRELLMHRVFAIVAPFLFKESSR